MKYIRTKDGIYSTSELIKCEDKRFSDGWFTKNGVPLIAINQADTIEELCDEFVGIDSQGHYLIHNDEFIRGARIVPLEEVNYYGAIWTDKGLIYVAKMNDKGELCLI